MRIRYFDITDMYEVTRLHKKFYADEFPLPDFNNPSFLTKYVVEDDKGKIIFFGGLNLLVEAVAITDKDASPRDIHTALDKFLTVATLTDKFTQLHCTVFDPKWMKQLVKRGFQKCKGVFLYYNI
jgi:hypothetical protein